VRVLTVHAAKGLEFPVVFVPNLSAGKFPSRGRPSLLPSLPVADGTESSGGNEQNELREEARLFFVALTRARDHLVLSRAERYNNRAAQPSPLLACLENVPDLRRERWEGAALTPTAAPGTPLPGLGGGMGVRAADTPLEAWEAELYLRCPRRFFYERVAELPAGEPSPYAALQRAVRAVLRALESGEAAATPDAAGALLDEHWAAAGLDPAHPHAPLYRTAINEIARRLAAKKDTAASNAPLPGKANPVSVVLSEGTITFNRTVAAHRPATARFGSATRFADRLKRAARSRRASVSRCCARPSNSNGSVGAGRRAARFRGHGRHRRRSSPALSSGRRRARFRFRRAPPPSVKNTLPPTRTRCAASVSGSFPPFPKTTTTALPVPTFSSAQRERAVFARALSTLAAARAAADVGPAPGRWARQARIR
jgi:hypothetical protein